jgi:outer membrane protein, heavy metal efflux system
MTKRMLIHMKRFLGLGIDGRLLFVMSGCLLLTGIPAMAERSPEPPPASLSLQEAFTLAGKNNLQLAAARRHLGVTQAAIITAGARPNPSLISDNGFAEKTYRVGVEQLIETGPKRHRRIAVAEAENQRAAVEIQTLSVELRSQLRRAYARLYNTQQRQATAQTVVDTTERLLKAAQQREQAGDIATFDVLQTDIAAVNARNEFQSLAYELVDARNHFNAILNQPLDTVQTLERPAEGPFLPELPSTGKPSKTPTATPKTEPSSQNLQGGIRRIGLDLPGLLERAMTNRPELSQNKLAQEVARRQLLLAQANRLPNLRLTTGYDLVTGTADGNSHGLFAIGNMEVPVFNRQQGPIAEARARETALTADAETLVNQITLQVASALNSLHSADNRLELYETELLPKAQAVVQKARQAFEAGKTNVLSPIHAQQAFAQTRLGYLQALQDQQNAISDLEKAVGSTL